MTTPRNPLDRLHQVFDWQFIRNSSVTSIGITLARVLGFAFSFVLARAFSTDDYGFVQYNITLATLVSIGTVPFVQQVMPWFISHRQTSDEQLVAVIGSSWFILLILYVGTLAIAIPVLGLIGRLNIGVLVIFTGLTLFYTYEGLSRGFLASHKLLLVYLGSNGLQLVAVIGAVVLLGTQSTLPALIIYGLSYVLPIALLQRIDPFPVAMRLRAVSAAVIRELLRFAAPVWVSHAFFTLSAAIDVLLLERFWGEEAVGVYALTRTIVMGFTFFPQGLTMLLMPKVAGSVEGQHRRILYSSLAINVLVVAVLFGIYLLLYRPVVTFVGEAYYIGMTFAVVMALSAAVYTVHAILTSYLVGRKQPELETVSRVVNTLVTVVGGLLLIPRLGVQGAAYASLLSAVLATLAYPTLLLLRPSGVLRR